MIDDHLVDNAVLELLRAQLEPGMEVYDAEVPRTASHPYLLVTRIPGEAFGGPPLWDPEADQGVGYQLDGVGRRRDEAEYALFRASRVLVGYTGGALTHPLPLPSTIAECGRLRSDTPPGVEKQGQPPNQVFTASGRFTVHVTPA